MRLEIPDDVTAEIRRAQSLAADGETVAAVAAYRALYNQVADDTAQAVAVLHMWAIALEEPVEKLAMNEQALSRADADPTFAPPLRATLLANLGYSHRLLGDLEAARSWYLEAQEAAAGLADDDYGTMMRSAIDNHLERFGTASDHKESSDSRDLHHLTPIADQPR